MHACIDMGVGAFACVRVCMCLCMRACVCACVCVCVRACVRACVSESLPVCVCVSSILGPGRPPLLPHCFSARSLTVGLSGLCCCVCVTYFERRLTPLFVGSERDAWQMGSTPGSVVLFGSLPARARK